MRCIPPSGAERGSSLIELLIGSTVMLTALGLAGSFFVTARNRIQDQLQHVETFQGLRAATDSMLRDLRLGGACLPISGDFITLDGVNATNGPDRITTRTGVVRANETCVRTVTTADIGAQDTNIPVQAASGFADGMRVYIMQANGTWGEVFTVTSVDTGANVLHKSATLTCQVGCGSPAYPAGSGLYAVDEREYAVDTTDPKNPVLTVAVNGAPSVPLVYGIEDLQIQYQLNDGCDTRCTVVDLPSSSQWDLVNQLYITVAARSRTVGSNGQYYRATRTAHAKPRNLLPGD
ncbi:MAG TPA: hypothetical protein VMW56_28600 [Candidatus Margulisiibacteriota bacterium]|nr:hypothetical protein [Candidatus Margulisiibacteriota bacterium]